jgi:hypothetical protein
MAMPSSLESRLQLVDRFKKAFRAHRSEFDEPDTQGEPPSWGEPELEPHERAIVDAVFGGDETGLNKLKDLFSEGDLIELHGEFGGKRGLVAVKRILRDVCGDKVADLSALIDAIAR